MSKFVERISNNPDYSEDQRNTMKRVLNTALPSVILGVIFNVVFITLVLTHVIDFSKLGKTEAEELPDIQSRIGYVLKYSTPGLFWLFFCVHLVIKSRSRSPAMDPMNNHEHLTLQANNILRNSIEQFILSLCSQLVLVTYLDAEHTLKYIPALTFMFILGRITFWLGYPQKRGFGFITTAYPTWVTIFYISYKFFGLYF